MKTLLCGVGLVVLGVAPAVADDAEPIGAPGLVDPATAAAPAPVADAPVRPRFTVTGSLIERATQTTPSPVTIISRDQLLASGRSMIGDVLQNESSQGNALNAQANNGGDGSTRIDLRGLGDARTLTLLNGRHFVPVGTGADATVDLNTIPLAVIERVEILKAGGSAIYGTDAVAGVVNIITRTNFTGTEASLYTAGSERGDGFTYDTSFITGHRSNSRNGNIIFSAGIQSQDPVFAGDREFSRFDKTFNFATRVEGVGGSSAVPAGRINARLIDVNGDGVPDPLNLCGVGIALCIGDGRGGLRPFIAPQDLYNYQPANYLYTPSSRFNAYTAGTYQLQPGMTGFFEASYMHRESAQQLAPEPLLPSPTISRDSIYNPYGGDVFDYRRRLEEFGGRRSLQSVDTLRTVVGIRGEMPDDVSSLQDWKWELSYNYGRTDATQRTEGNLILSHLQNAVGPSFINSNGVPTCGTPSAPIDGCVPMNVLGPSGSIGPDAVAYTAFTGLSSGVDEQHVVAASAHGRLVRLPGGGDIALALATDFRKETGDFTPDPLIATGDTTGPARPAVHGSTSALEAFAELSIVPLRDAAGVERLELDLSARAVRYDTFGSGVTSKAAALARPINGVTLRATYSADYRAPSIFELFESAGQAFPAGEDPCDHLFDLRAKGVRASTRDEQCAKQGVPPDAEFGTAQQRVLTRGNPALRAETAKIATAGVVVEPFQGSGLSISADYWNIELAHEIQRPTLAAIFTNCYDRGIQSFCDQVHRDPAQGFAIDFVDTPTVNLGGRRTIGVDAAVELNRRAGPRGAFQVRAEAQRLLEVNVDNGARVLNGLGVYDFGVYPTIKANLSTALQLGGLGVGANLKLVGGFLECENNDCNGNTLSRDVEDYAKVDVFSSFTSRRAGSQTTLTVGVNNVFDRPPPTIYIGFHGDSDSATYDYLGRFFYARLSQQF